MRWVVLGLLLFAAACSDAAESETSGPADINSPPAVSTVASTVPATTSSAPTTAPPTIKGGVPVAVIAVDGRGGAKVQATPFALRERDLPTDDLLPAPADDGVFRSTVSAVPDNVLARSTWTEDCPVPPEELSYINVSFIGFDDEPHTGEMIMAAEYAEGVVGIFEMMFDQRFPIEEMRVVTQADTTPPHFGDTNNTSSFVCRTVTGGSRFSEHAYGLALDINPFHNPYIKGLNVIPALSESFGDRQWDRKGMILPDSPIVAAFERIGWKWGGNWRSLKDYQHFSHNGR